jgi:nitric oxide reductase NorD protein
VGRQWPALGKDLVGLLAGVEIGDPDADGPTLLERAVRRARSKVPLPEPPPLLGVLPRTEPVIAPKLLRPEGHASRRMPWSMRQTQTKKKKTRIAVGGRGGDNATNGSIGAIELDDDITWQSRRVGLPYDEWNFHAGEYRKGFVTVLEFPAPTLSSPSPQPPPDIASWFRWSPDRMWLRGREDGTEVDLEAYVDEYCRAFAGEAVENRIYADIGEAPRDVATAVLLDASGSLDAHGGRSLALELACADALAGAMSETGEPHAIFSFTGDTRHRVEVRVLRDFADNHPLSHVGLRPGGYTRLGAPLRHVTRRLLEVPAQRRILLALGDGMPCDEGYEGPYAEADVAKAVEEAIDHGITIFYLGVGSVRRDPLPTMFGPGRFQRLRRLSDLPEALAVTHEGLRQQ